VIAAVLDRVEQPVAVLEMLEDRVTDDVAVVVAVILLVRLTVGLRYGVLETAGESVLLILAVVVLDGGGDRDPLADVVEDEEGFAVFVTVGVPLLVFDD